MRKIVLCFAFLGLFALVSCQKGKAGIDATLIINTKALYDELGIVEEIESCISTHSGIIVDSVFVYGLLGQLILRLGTETHSLSPVSFSLGDLEEGDYTVVVWQYYREEQEKERWFSLQSEELSSLCIHCVDNPMECIWSLGVATSAVTIDNSSDHFMMVPEAAGSIVDFQLNNYVKGPWDLFDQALPPVWLYGEKSVVGLYPGRNDKGRWMVFPDQQDALGRLEEGEHGRKFFTLLSGENITVSICGDGGSLRPYFQGKINLSPGCNSVCYYDFSPKTFYDAYCGTPEGAIVFMERQERGDVSLYPYTHWGASRTEVDQFLSSRDCFPCQDGEVKVWDSSLSVQFDIAPGLSETYVYQKTDATDLGCVVFEYEGVVSQEKVQSAMEHLGYKYLGERVLDISIARFYLSSDGQTEFVIHAASDVICLFGINSWFAYFYPVNAEELAALGLEGP